MITHTEKFRSSLLCYLLVILLVFVYYSCSNIPTTSNATQNGKLTVSLDSALNGDEDIVMIHVINRALLYKFSDTNTIVSTAVISGGNAVFDVKNLNPGDYYFIFDDSTMHRSPVYIPDGLQNYNVRVGTSLRLSVVISDAGDTLFKFKTHAFADDEHEVLKYSNDEGTGRYSYAIMKYQTRTLEIRYSDDASVINSIQKSSSGWHHYYFTSWDLGLQNHGIEATGDSLTTEMKCGYCHTNFWAKPTQWSDITVENGWCNKCHKGFLGACGNIYDKNQ